MFVRLRPYVLVRRAGVVERVRKSKSRVRKAADCLEDDGKVVAERKDRSIWWNLPEQSSFDEADSGEEAPPLPVRPAEQKDKPSLDCRSWPTMKRSHVDSVRAFLTENKQKLQTKGSIVNSLSWKRLTFSIVSLVQK